MANNPTEVYRNKAMILQQQRQRRQRPQPRQQPHRPQAAAASHPAHLRFMMMTCLVFHTSSTGMPAITELGSCRRSRGVAGCGR